MQESRNPIANALELSLPCTNPSIYSYGHDTVLVSAQAGSDFGVFWNWVQTFTFMDHLKDTHTDSTAHKKTGS